MTLNALARAELRCYLKAATGLATVVAFASTATAQTADGGAPAESVTEVTEEVSEDILVTGSRIVRNGFNAPTPITVMDSALTQDLGQVNAGETLRLISRPLPRSTARSTSRSWVRSADRS